MQFSPLPPSSLVPLMPEYLSQRLISKQTPPPGSLLIKVKPSHYKPGDALRVQEIEAPRTCKQSTNESGKLVSSTHRPPLPIAEDPWYSFLLQVESTPVT